MTATFTDPSVGHGVPPRRSAPSPGWTPGAARTTGACAWRAGCSGSRTPASPSSRSPSPSRIPRGMPSSRTATARRTSETRRKTGRCTAPGKHPVGESWQRSGSRDLTVIAGILRQPGFQLGVIVLPGGRGFILDEDLRTGVDADALMAGWAEREGAEATRDLRRPLRRWRPPHPWPRARGLRPARFLARWRGPLGGRRHQGRWHGRGSLRAASHGRPL